VARLAGSLYVSADVSRNGSGKMYHQLATMQRLGHLCGVRGQGLEVKSWGSGFRVYLQVDIRIYEDENGNSHGARPVY